MGSRELPALIIGLLLIGIIGSYILLNPQSEVAKQAIIALLPIAGSVVGYYFHAVSTGQANGFFGQQLDAQRVANRETLQTTLVGTTTSSSGSSSKDPIPTPTRNPMNPETGGV
jgi:hypothetical protein